MPANKIKLEICGSNYVIATTDTEEYVLSLAEKLDSDMTQMLASNPTASVTTAAVITAIGNHDEKTANAVTPLSAALILADKSDVRRSRVRISLEAKNFDIHDRVNYAVEESSLTVQKEEGLITLALRIDTSITAVMDYFEIFLSRMTLCRAAASFLGLDFELVINETRML